jgi:hypothetical protein
MGDSSSLSQSSATSSSSGHPLPSWIFDIDDNDDNNDLPNQKSLLEELEIDPNHIYRLVSLFYI